MKDLIKEFNIIELLKVAVGDGAIQDHDTNFRVVNELLPQEYTPIRELDSQEISGHYRKIHLSDMILAAKNIMSGYLEMRGDLAYIKMRLAQIASQDYKACGLSAEVIAQDCLRRLQ